MKFGLYPKPGSLTSNPIRHSRQRHGSRRRPRFHPELYINMFQVFVHGARAELEDVADVFVGFAAGDPAQDFDFAFGELEAAGEFAVGGFVVETQAGGL